MFAEPRRQGVRGLLAAGCLVSLAGSGLAAPETEVLPEGTATVTITDSDRLVDPAPLAIQRVTGMFLDAPGIMIVSIDGTGKARGLTLVIHGRPEPGKTYPLGADPEAGPAALRYLETSVTGGPDLEKMHLHRKAWVSTAGSVTVTAYASQAMAAEVRGAIMAAEQTKDNEASGSFRIDLKCEVSGIVEM